MPENHAAPPAPAETTASSRWLNRNVMGMAVTSFLSDLGHESATAVLPAFLSLLGVPPAGLGAIEGVADATSSFVKLWTGWISDRMGRRKPITVAGYALTGASQAVFAAASGFPLVLLGRTVGWFGRGVRGPLRNAILADSVPARDRGKAFGFHRAADTLGAVVGPLCAVLFLHLFARGPGVDPTTAFRWIFLLSVIPGLGAALVFAVMVRERIVPGGRQLRFWATMRSMPAPMRRALGAVGVFGLGDFSHTLIILAAVELLRPSMGPLRASTVAGLLYVLHNLAYAVTPFPVGALSDRHGRGGLLAGGYALGATVSASLGLCLMAHVTSVPLLAAIFLLAGVTMGFVDTLEGALLADVSPVESRGTSYGALGTVNGVGDLASSLIVGALWTLHPLWGFGYAAVMMLAGAILVGRLLPRHGPPPA